VLRTTSQGKFGGYFLKIDFKKYTLYAVLAWGM
jgi:hypothetical protein